MSRLSVGVIGVGSMGKHHARVYAELPTVDLVGVADADPKTAMTVAEEYGTRAVETERLLADVDAVSVATPNRFHYEYAREAIDRGVHVIVEKPFVEDRSQGRDLVDRAAAADLVLQVGHVERFNPAVSALRNVLDGQEIIAVEADRLGPPVDRDVSDDPVLDLMIHDIDVVTALVDGSVTDVHATHAPGRPYVTATLAFDTGVVGRLTASRVTQQKVRTLSFTAEAFRANADYLSQSVEIHRHSVPEFVDTDGDLRYRHESIIERPIVKNGEPLKAELRSFAEAVQNGTDPVVTGEDGLRALAIAQRIRRAGDGETPEVKGVIR